MWHIWKVENLHKQSSSIVSEQKLHPQTPQVEGYPVRLFLC